MKAMNVRSAEELAVGSPQGKALFDLTPARSSPAKQSAFTNALKNAALKFRNHAESPPESVETRKSFDSDDPSAAILGMREPSSDVPSQPKAAPVVEASPLSGNREETREPAASVSGETTPPASTEDVQLCGFPRSPWVSGSPAEGRYSVTSPSETANFSAVMAPDSLAPGLETEVAQEKVFPEQVPFLSDIVGSVGNGQEEGEVGWPKLQEIFAESGAETWHVLVRRRCSAGSSPRNG
ncbi:MAG: hypothetical protein HY801_06770 [Candidatus Lindowbacteria bacterium]|nr:hypothetical protein [Candidatus Lindowbacteria bacterium]